MPDITSDDKEKTLKIDSSPVKDLVETQSAESTTFTSTKPFKLPLVKQSRSKWPIFIGLIAIIFFVVIGSMLAMILHASSSPQTAVVIPSPTPHTSPSPVASNNGPELDLSKNYGNKYANGILPVGDNKYSTASAKVGSIYACSQYAANLTTDQGGAGSRGPWFVNNNTEYDATKKVHVAGNVKWQGVFKNAINGTTRTITTNDLPLSDSTGIFPIQSSDPAYQYDANPNTITAQSFTYNLAAAPKYGNPQCMGGQVGVMLSGVALFNAFDAGGRDAGAWEVQDSCGGHPEKDGIYHYHTLSNCISDMSVQTVLGFALDGFPITGPKVTASSILTTSDLDACHGTTSNIIIDGKTVNTYHYVMTQDFPYSVSCFRSAPIAPPGLSQSDNVTNPTPQNGAAQANTPAKN